MIHTNFYRKALIRQPVRSLLFILLITMLTYAFVSHAVEALLVQQETDRLEEYYKPIGKLTSDEIDIRAGQALIVDSPYIELNDVRRSCTGVLEGYQNADIDATGMARDMMNYVNDVVFVGSLNDKRYVEREEGGYYELDFAVKKVEAGYNDYIREGSRVTIMCLPGIEEASYTERFYFPQQQDEAYEKEYNQLKIGSSYLLRAYYYELNGVNSINSARNGYAGSRFVQEMLLPDRKSLYFYNVLEGEDIDYESPELNGLFSYVKFLRRNQSAIELVGTKDMSRIPVCQESERRYYLTDGRWLTREDDMKQNKVCVVHDFFAKRRGLKVGDKIRIKMENVDCSYGYGYLPWKKLDNLQWKEWAELEDCEYREEEFEIVGTYNDLEFGDQFFLTFYTLQIFTPDSCIPKEFQLRDALASGGAYYYSFVLKKPQDQQKFLVEYGDRLAELGIEAKFVDNNADNFAVTAEKIRHSTIFGTLVFGCVLCVGIVFISGLYLGLRRRETAIARALGVPVRKTVLGAVGAFGWIAVPGIFLGCMAGWHETLRSAEEILKPFTELGVSAGEMTLPLKWLGYLTGAILFMAAIITFIGIGILAAQPILPLLQGGKLSIKLSKGKQDKDNSRKKQNRNIKEQENDVSEVHFGDVTDMVNLQSERKNTIFAGMRYLCRHQFRAYGKTLIVLLVSVGAVVIPGWMQDTMQKNQNEIERIYRTTIIEGDIAKADSGSSMAGTGGGYIQSDVIAILKAKLEENDIIDSMYVEETAEAKFVYGIRAGEKRTADSPFLESVSLMGIDEWDGFKKKTGDGMSIQFFEEDETTFIVDRESSVNEYHNVIVPEIIMTALALEGGDTLDIYDSSGHFHFLCKIVGVYTGGSRLSSTIIMHKVTLHDLVGLKYYGQAMRVHFNPEKNRELLEYGEELEQFVQDCENVIPLRLILWDGELHTAVEPMERTLSLFHILYPVATAVFFILGAGFQVLLLIQRSKEAAVMRILGNSTSNIRILFVVEQICLCLLGIAAGTLLLWTAGWHLNRNIVLSMGLYLLGSIIGICIGSTAVTGRKPLELLQTKE